ncbi:MULTISPECIES: transcription/translation regulatory transformer protein RfaH [Pseudomonas syringae group]|uniref:Transcription antitermination protein RfaH n=1 Tax=Pseudomonas syringae pv. primulae TaxID=251707 RepID=A0A0P9Y2D3_9PSED|nr:MULTISPECIES: transcription/translation regulatory transformer protein RfaH [Pseudomonas syringae group]KPY35894.1 Transcription antitermination protein RfaH [Pseudomonas syringae pv. primulae]MBD8203269.1 transcription/translation regulatory transformer protein RfaH [Pseudomonas viridiflava]MDY0935521.1 transcription/translation regulatory transformer protein RfaH [Pseudomonas viridiflava]MDY1011587.1 transcription/translation regulatory transformer protein RfaH [Pseudomonas viridiflava]ME
MSLSERPARWYLIQTKPRQEARAEEHLQRQHFECYRPLKSGERKRSNRTSVEEELFPGYLFIRMDQVHDNWYPIRSTRGVARIVTFGGHPVPVRDELIEQIRQRLSAPAPRMVFTQGEPVLIKAGGFCDVEAIFLANDGTERAVILLNMLQRQQKVVLPISSLARMEARA